MAEGEDGIRLLLIGAAHAALRAAATMAREAGADVMLAEDADDALATMRTTGVALVMIDVATDVAAFMARLRAERFAVRVIACGIDAPAERAVAAIRAGACDYVPLPPDRALIAAALTAAATPPAATLIGEDAALLRAVSFGRSIAPGRMPVLIQGEPETGRTALARAIHAASGRHGRFVALECAGIAADLVDADLFGYEAGAFPAATARRRGKFDAAIGGTLFVRDVERLPPATQDRLSAALAADGGQVRLIAATAADLAERVQDGAFRADLATRLAIARIAMPPLRERPGDVAALAAHFATGIAHAQDLPPPAFRDAALALLAAYRWPGNVRELEDVVHRATILAHGPVIGAEHLVLADGTRLAADTAHRDEGGETGVDRLVGRTVEEVERALILKTLERCRGNRTSASGILGISVRTMRNKLRSFVEAGIPVAPAA